MHREPDIPTKPAAAGGGLCSQLRVFALLVLGVVVLHALALKGLAQALAGVQASTATGPVFMARTLVLDTPRNPIRLSPRLNRPSRCVHPRPLPRHRCRLRPLLPYRRPPKRHPSQRKMLALWWRSATSNHRRACRLAWRRPISIWRHPAVRCAASARVSRTMTTRFLARYDSNTEDQDPKESYRCRCRPSCCGPKTARPTMRA